MKTTIESQLGNGTSETMDLETAFMVCGQIATKLLEIQADHFVEELKCTLVQLSPPDLPFEKIKHYKFEATLNFTVRKVTLCGTVSSTQRIDWQVFRAKQTVKQMVEKIVEELRRIDREEVQEFRDLVAAVTWENLKAA